MGGGVVTLVRNVAQIVAAWIAAVLQTGVNLGVMLAYVATYLFAGFTTQRYVFLVGILPALIVFWIRRAVPEPEEWHTANNAATGASTDVGSVSWAITSDHAADDCGVRVFADGMVGVHVLVAAAHPAASGSGGADGCGKESTGEHNAGRADRLARFQGIFSRAGWRS